MARHGGKRHLKRIAVPRIIPIVNRKKYVFKIRPNPGKHPLDRAFTPVDLLRDFLSLAYTRREVEKYLKSRNFFVDGKVVSDEKYALGLSDIIVMKSPEDGSVFWQGVISFDEKGKLTPIEVAKGYPEIKLLQVIRKTSVKGGKLQLTFHDGRNYLSDNNLKVAVGDSVLFDLKNKKVVKHLPLSEGALCLVIAGRHRGRFVKLLRLDKEKKGNVELQDVKKGETFTTKRAYVMPVPSERWPYEWS